MNDFYGACANNQFDCKIIYKGKEENIADYLMQKTKKKTKTKPQNQQIKTKTTPPQNNKKNPQEIHIGIGVKSILI